MRRQVDRPREGSTRQLVVLLALAFVVTLGVVVGTRMSSDAIAVLVGVVAGVAASIPTALLLMAVTRRREEEDRIDRVGRVRRYDDRAMSAPPVIVVAPGNVPQAQLPYPASFAYESQPGGRQRRFRIVGYDEEDDAPVEAEVENTSWRT